MIEKATIELTDGKAKEVLRKIGFSEKEIAEIIDHCSLSLEITYKPQPE